MEKNKRESDIQSRSFMMEVEVQSAIVDLLKREKKLADEEEEDEEEERWMKHYSSLHQILLVGDGDLSFSLCLAMAFGSASNIVSSTLDSFDQVTKKYKNAKSNIEKLVDLGATILHGVDAIKMKLHTDLRMRKFDRIIFNFPHAGFHGKEDATRLIQMHRKLVSGFFHSASGMLRPDGEIHVNHKTTAPFCHWDLTGLASNSSLVLFECVDFRITDYPGYNNKRGDGPRCDDPFPLGQCSTFKYVFSPHAKKIPNPSRQHCGFAAAQRPPRVQAAVSPYATFGGQYSSPNAYAVTNNNLDHNAALFKPSLQNECFRFFGAYFNHVMQTFGMVDRDIHFSVHQGLEHACNIYTGENREKCLSGYIYLLEQLHHLSQLRSAWLRKNLFLIDHHHVHHHQPLM
ncbi:hypothetical protein DM860_000502 [Cuscuta australis]|uniref:25S rRNA (uridine-N(3))-methyltransferase BMT5-like domain-containing protein n=1 Tax=Cuscuta australis TaxID=267555 RepID=A0A328CZH3_9ASTE|nr:hypothetical protein DM860_000502 [Cuscuta australis]